MKLAKRDYRFLHEMPDDPALKGACLLLAGGFHAAPETDELPRHLLPNLPGVVLCRSCDSFLARLLNQRGVAITSPIDPVGALSDGAEVDVDLASGVLTEAATGRRFALRPLHAAHMQEMRANRGANA
jgi:voltage-gated potassium channel Kch